MSINCENWLPQFFKDQQSRSIVKLSLPQNGECFSCTGTLLAQRNVETNDFRFYVLTAKHCIKKDDKSLMTQQELLNTFFIFNYQRSNCDALIPGENGLNMGAQDQTRGRRYYIRGARLVDHSDIPDFALLEITSPIPPHYKPYFSGWSTSPLSNFNAPFYAIHHPRGDVKSISRTYNVTEDFFYIPIFSALPWPFNLIYSLIIGWTPISNNYIVDIWSNGGTEQGSSGSALFNSNGRVIGTLTGNPFDCFIGSDYYGKFSKQWLYNQGLRQALNPHATGLNMPIGIAGAEVSCYRGDLHLQGDYYPARDYQPENQITIQAENKIIAASNLGAGRNDGTDDGELIIYNRADFVFEAGNEITLSAGFSVEMGGTFHAEIKPCVTHKNGDFPADDGEFSCVFFNNDSTEKVIENSQPILPTFSPSPNPFSTSTTFHFNLPSVNLVHIRITDALGVLVYDNKNPYEAGKYSLEWDASKLSSGVYFVQFQVSDFVIIKKIVKS